MNLITEGEVPGIDLYSCLQQNVAVRADRNVFTRPQKLIPGAKSAGHTE
jgi:hypothetical protein